MAQDTTPEYANRYFRGQAYLLDEGDGKVIYAKKLSHAEAGVQLAPTVQLVYVREGTESEDVVLGEILVVKDSTIGVLTRFVEDE